MLIYRRSLWISVIIVWALFLAGGNSLAVAEDKFPNKPITFISGWPGGGAGDQEIRGFALYLKKYLPVETTIVNLPGAGTRIAATKAYKSKPDGYTLLYMKSPQPILNEYMYETQYKTNEFMPVYSFVKTSVAMTVNSESWKSVDEFLKTARTRTVSIGLSSLGSVSHLAALSAVKAWGISVNYVPFETGSQPVAQVAGKHIDAAFTAATTAIPLMRSGMIRALLIFSDTPVEGFENVPTPRDLGYNMPLVSLLGGIVAPPKTPAHEIRILEEACAKTVKDPEILAWAAKSKYELVQLPSEAFKKQITEQYKVVEANIDMIRASMTK